MTAFAVVVGLAGFAASLVTLWNSRKPRVLLFFDVKRTGNKTSPHGSDGPYFPSGSAITSSTSSVIHNTGPIAKEAVWLHAVATHLSGPRATGVRGEVLRIWSGIPESCEAVELPGPLQLQWSNQWKPTDILDIDPGQPRRLDVLERLKGDSHAYFAGLGSGTGLRDRLECGDWVIELGITPENGNETAVLALHVVIPEEDLTIKCRRIPPREDPRRLGLGRTLFQVVFGRR